MYTILFFLSVLTYSGEGISPKDFPSKEIPINEKAKPSERAYSDAGEIEDFLWREIENEAGFPLQTPLYLFEKLQELEKKRQIQKEANGNWFVIKGNVLLEDGNFPPEPLGLSIVVKWPWGRKDIVPCTRNGFFRCECALEEKRKYSNYPQSNVIVIYPLPECFTLNMSDLYFYRGYTTIFWEEHTKIKEVKEVTLKVKPFKVKSNLIRVRDQFDNPVAKCKIMFQPMIPMGDTSDAFVWSDYFTLYSEKDGSVSFKYVESLGTYQFEVKYEKDGHTYEGKLVSSAVEVGNQKHLNFRIHKEAPSLIVYVKWDERLSLGEFHPDLRRILAHALRIREMSDRIAQMDERGKLLFYKVPPGKYTLEFLPEGQREYRPTQGTEKLVIPPDAKEPVVHVMTVEPVNRPPPETSEKPRKGMLSSLLPEKVRFHGRVTPIPQSPAFSIREFFMETIPSAGPIFVQPDGSFEKMIRPGKYQLALVLVVQPTHQPKTTSWAMIHQETLIIPPWSLEKNIPLKPLSELVIQLKEEKPADKGPPRHVLLRRLEDKWLAGGAPFNERGQAILFMPEGAYEIVVFPEPTFKQAASCGQITLQAGKAASFVAAPTQWKRFAKIERVKGVFEGEPGFAEEMERQEKLKSWIPSHSPEIAKPDSASGVESFPSPFAPTDPHGAEEADSPPGTSQSVKDPSAKKSSQNVPKASSGNAGSFSEDGGGARLSPTVMWALVGLVLLGGGGGLVGWIAVRRKNNRLSRKAD